MCESGLSVAEAVRDGQENNTNEECDETKKRTVCWCASLSLRTQSINMQTHTIQK